jgi:hypothetical protein
MKAMKGDLVGYSRCIKLASEEGIVEAVYNKGSPNELYSVRRTTDGAIFTLSPKDIDSAVLAIRAKKSTKPKVKKSRK